MTIRRRRLLPREQVLAIVAGGLMAVWLVISGWGLPRLTAWREARQRVRVSQRKLDRLLTLTRSQPGLAQRLQAASTFHSSEAEEALQTAFLDELEQWARAGTLQLALKPRPVEREERLVRLGVELDVEGSQESLLQFLERLLTEPALIDVERLRLSATASKDRTLRITLLVTKLLVRP